MKITAAALVLISLAALLALPCVCVADQAASGHGCCAPRTSMQAAADTCCPPQAEPKVASAPFAVPALSSEMPASFAEPGLSPSRSTPLPRRIAWARTPILRI
jgi:hypothetical protein